MNWIMKNIKIGIPAIIVSLVTLLSLSLPSVGMQSALAACDSSLKESAVCGINSASGGTASGTSFEKVVSDVVRILSLIVGILAIIMLIVGGFRYITSGGESGRVAAAKNTIVYALIGLAVAVLAQAFVQFVLGKAAHV